MSINGRLLILLACVIAAGTLVFFLFSPDGPTRIRNAVETGKAGIENEDVGKTMSVVSYAYRDELGFAYVSLKKFFEDMFGQLDSIRIAYAITGIDILKDTARVALDVSGSAVEQDEPRGIVGSSDTPEKLEMIFVRKGLGWKVISSHWPQKRSIEDFYDMVQ